MFAEMFALKGMAIGASSLRMNQVAMLQETIQMTKQMESPMYAYGVDWKILSHIKDTWRTAKKAG